MRAREPIVNGLGRTAAWLTAGAAAGSGALAAITSFKLNGTMPPPPYTFTPFEVRAESEDVAFMADDGVPLSGWWLEQEGSPIVVICCHGHRGNKADMLGIGSGLWRAGHSVLLFDFRGSGDSGAGEQSLAYYEQRDVRAAVGLVRERRPDAKIALVAFSMGAATAIMAAGEDPRIDALVADSSFATMSGVVATAYRRFHVPGTPFVTIADLVNRVWHGYSFGDVRPVDRIGHIAPRPLLLLHGTEDKIIPYAHVEQLAAAAGPGAAEVVTFEGAEHCGGYFQDRPAYIALVDDFLRRSLA